MDLAAVDQNPLHGLGDPVPSDLLGAESGHQADDQAPTNRDNDSDGAKGVSVRRDEGDAETLIVEKVGEEPDHVQQSQGDAGRQRADDQRQRNEAQQGGRGREIAERRFLLAPRPIVSEREPVPIQLADYLGDLVRGLGVRAGI